MVRILWSGAWEIFKANSLNGVSLWFQYVHLYQNKHTPKKNQWKCQDAQKRKRKSIHSGVRLSASATLKWSCVPGWRVHPATLQSFQWWKMEHLNVSKTTPGSGVIWHTLSRNRQHTQSLWQGYRGNFTIAALLRWKADDADTIWIERQPPIKQHCH